LCCAVSRKLEASSTLICHEVAAVIEIQDILGLRGTILRTESSPLVIMSRECKVPAGEGLEDEHKEK
jgi:hypothetical protein